MSTIGVSIKVSDESKTAESMSAVHRSAVNEALLRSSAAFRFDFSRCASAPAGALVRPIYLTLADSFLSLDL